VIEKGQERLDSVAYPASRFCVGPQTLAAHRKSALGTVSSTQGACVGSRDKRNQRVAYCLTLFWNSRVALVGT
jgi:hypothetical protein